MNRVIGRSVILMILVVALTGGMFVFVLDYFANSDDWVMSEGSPHVYTDYSSVSGLITDRNGVLLMDTTNGRVYAQNELLRKSIIHWLGDRQGNIYAPTIGHYAAQLTGHSLIDGLYVYGNDGGRVTLTLSAQAQMAALEALGDRKGTVAVYNYKTGEILCAVTNPTYDPDNLPDIAGDTEGLWDGAYINRFLKGAYIPGSIFKIVTAAAALEEIDDIWDQTFTCTGEVDYGTYDVTCEKVHGKLDFDSALAESCNCAFSQIVEQLGKEKLLEYVDKYNVTQSVSFDGATTASGNFDLTDTSRLDVAWSGIGQHRDEVNPCRYLTFISAIANGGLEVQPYLMQKITCDGENTYQATVQYGEQIMSQAVASELQHMLRNNVIETYGEENFPDLQVCGKSGTAQVGGGKEPNAMFTGFVLDEEYPIAFFVAVEGGGYGRQTCVPILSQVLEACMDIM